MLLFRPMRGQAMNNKERNEHIDRLHHIADCLLAFGELVGGEAQSRDLKLSFTSREALYQLCQDLHEEAYEHFEALGISLSTAGACHE